MYEAPEYTPEPFVVHLNNFFRSVRFLYTTEFSDVLSPYPVIRDDYLYGLIFFSTLMAIVIFSWGVLLVLLKCRSQEVGCAAGNAIPVHLDDVEEANDPASRRRLSNNSQPSADRRCCSRLRLKQSFRRRAKRTRTTFIVFGFGALACVVLLTVMGFAPLKESLDRTEELMTESQDILDQVSSSIRTIDATGEQARQSAERINTDFASLCPGGPSSGVVLDIDVADFLVLARTEFEDFDAILTNNITNINETLASVQTIKDGMEEGFAMTKDLGWLVPGLLLVVAIASTVAMNGVLLAWRGKSSQNHQKFMSYGALPFIIVLCLVCWVATIAVANTAMAAGDMCIAGGERGGPDATIAETLALHNVKEDTITFRMISSYTGGCHIENPNRELVELEENLQDAVNSIWLNISKIDAIGRGNLAQACNASLDEFFAGTRQLANSLGTIRKAVDSTIDTLECSNINALYVEAVHDELCGQVSESLSISFILLVALTVCLMIMVLLRASWLNKSERDDEKVYDECEVADNMVLDEYEEYLQYISKYKHEWEEYEGFDAPHVAVAEVIEVEHTDDDVVTLREDEIFYDQELENNREVSEYESETEYESSVEERSGLRDDISFPSLQLTPSIENAVNSRHLQNMPSLLIPSNRSHDDNEIEMEAIEMVANVYGIDSSVSASDLPITILETTQQGHEDDISEMDTLNPGEEGIDSSHNNRGIPLTIFAISRSSDSQQKVCNAPFHIADNQEEHSLKEEIEVTVAHRPGEETAHGSTDLTQANTRVKSNPYMLGDEIGHRSIDMTQTNARMKSNLDHIIGDDNDGLVYQDSFDSETENKSERQSAILISSRQADGELGVPRDDGTKPLHSVAPGGSTKEQSSYDYFKAMLKPFSYPSKPSSIRSRDYKARQSEIPKSNYATNEEQQDLASRPSEVRMMGTPIQDLVHPEHDDPGLVASSGSGGSTDDDLTRPTAIDKARCQGQQDLKHPRSAVRILGTSAQDLVHPGHGDPELVASSGSGGSSDNDLARPIAVHKSGHQEQHNSMPHQSAARFNSNQVFIPPGLVASSGSSGDDLAMHYGGSTTKKALRSPPAPPRPSAPFFDDELDELIANYKPKTKPPITVSSTRYALSSPPRSTKSMPAYSVGRHSAPKSPEYRYSKSPTTRSVYSPQTTTTKSPARRTDMYRARSPHATKSPARRADPYQRTIAPKIQEMVEKFDHF